MNTEKILFSIIEELSLKNIPPEEQALRLLRIAKILTRYPRPLWTRDNATPVLQWVIKQMNSTRQSELRPYVLELQAAFEGHPSDEYSLDEFVVLFVPNGDTTTYFELNRGRWFL